MTSIRIAGKLIQNGHAPFVIAEAGVNHNGRLSLALKLIDAAAKAGADAVKFQTFKAEQVVTGQGKMAAYQLKNLKRSRSQVAMLRALELQESWYRRLIARCRAHGILFMSSPHGGFSSVDFLHRLGVPAFKFGSGDLTNLPVLEYAARLQRPLIVATGMATMAEVQAAVQTVKRTGNHRLVLLHATTNYPCPPEEVNLAAMVTMMRDLPYPVGYSDHTIGIDVPYTAAALGACMIEKHLTLDRKMPGPDHRASTEPDEFGEMIKRIRQLPVITGSPIKRPNPSELRMMPTIRKSLVVTKTMRQGQRFTAKTLGIKRPGTGLSPTLYFTVIGKKAQTDIPADTMLRPRHYA